jgi:nucleotide-binding universal stress UspA family protein
MKRAFHIKRILVPIDFSETASLALEHATFMAKLLKAELHLLYVMEAHSFVSSISQAFSKTKSDYEEKIESSAADRFKDMVSKIHHDTGMPVESHVLKGKIYKTIIHTASELNADIIIMGTHGASGFQEHLIGSNAYKVVSNAPCPVITVQTHIKKVGFHDIVLPIDNSPTSRQKVTAAIEIAKFYKSVIHIAGLITSSNEETLRKFDVKINQVKYFIEEHEVPYTIKTINGEHLSTLLMDYGSQINADLMIIMTDQEGGLFMGSGAQKIVNHSKIPIMSVTPSEGDPDKISLGY